MTTAPLPTTVAVSLSHDGSAWTDITSEVLSRRPLTYRRGRNRVLGEWIPGNISGGFENTDRNVDPTNDSATFQPRPGDEIKVEVNGALRWRGQLDTASVSYDIASDRPHSVLSLVGSDGLSVIARATVSDPGTVGNIMGTGDQVDIVLALSDLNYANAATTDTGDVATALPATGTFNALSVLQTCTRTEGGNAQLFTLKDGTLRWRSRYARPSTVATFGGSGQPFSSIQVDYTDDEWANSVNVTYAAHTDTEQTSTTSVTTGTGTKNFTLAAAGGPGNSFGFSAGAAVYIESTGAPSNNMTGTVTSFDESTRALVTSIASKNGTATRTDWAFTFTETAATVSAKDAQSRDAFRQYRTSDISTHHRNTLAATAEATILAASRAWPSRRISSVTVNLGHPSVTIATVLALEIGDAIDVSHALGTGTPSTLRQVRQIDGISEVIDGTGTHSITFTLGNEIEVDFTATIKQNGAAKGTTLREGTYVVRDGWVEVIMVLEADSTGTANTEIKATPVGLPAPLQTGHKAHGICVLSASSTVQGTCYFDGTDIILHRDASTAPMGQSPNITLGSGGRISAVLVYPTQAAKTFTAYIEQAGVAKSATTTGYYTERDGMVTAVISITANAAGSAGNAILITPTGLPAPADSGNSSQGWATYYVASSGTWYPMAARFDTVNIRCQTHNRNGLIGVAPSLAVASGDTFDVTLEYAV